LLGGLRLDSGVPSRAVAREPSLRGLLSPVERKNGCHLTEAAGNSTPDGVQEFLSRALIDRALYVPDAWAGDAARRREARIPADVALVTVPKQGLAVSGEPLGSTLERARAAGVPFAWVAGDSVYGADSAIRRWAGRHRCGYVLAVTSGQRLAMRPGRRGLRAYPTAHGIASAQGTAPRGRSCMTGRICPTTVPRRASPARP
jgi:hypothetical protein